MKELPRGTWKLFHWKWYFFSYGSECLIQSWCQGKRSYLTDFVLPRKLSNNCIVLNGRGIWSRTVASEASPTTVWLQWFSILRALPSESNTTMREKLGYRRLQNWLPPSREKPPGVGTADFKSVMRGAFRSLSGRCSCWGVPSTGTRPCGENFKS